MKTLLAVSCAGALVLAVATPASALMRGNPSNPDYKTKYSSGPPPSADMTKPAKPPMKKQKRR